MNISEYKDDLIQKTMMLNSKIDFKYRDLLKMNEKEREEKTKIIKTRNELLEQINIVNMYNVHPVTFSSERYARFRMYTTSELIERAVSQKMEAEIIGGKDFGPMIKVYENMKKEAN